MGVRMSTEVTDTFSSFHRLTLNKTRLLVQAAKGFMSKSASRGSKAGSEGDNESMDYLPLVSRSSLGLAGVAWSLQRSRGGFPRIFLLLSLTTMSSDLPRDRELFHPYMPYS